MNRLYQELDITMPDLGNILSVTLTEPWRSLLLLK
jgi:hypothetical protein